ncbi:LIM domain-containing protein PLIM2b-like [Hevea brasiliensis]|uniref:LIM domain-containing protein PLIM2b-like n=1 Tax=Hevea brasiliensis TaxID=3981 RepID=UPI0025DE2A78|nr:LIM domain-containing protein PLIM2b-like [Hevea brasiliensis]
MVFSGTTEKCKACDKTVHFIEMITADGISYHKTCFKCSHCNGLLLMSSYSSMDGVLYCKPHFDQLFRETGSFSKKFPTSGDKKNGLARAPGKLSSMFCGTQDKCARCNKTAYPLEKVSVEGESYHKTCFRCSHGGCYLTPSSYAAIEGILYCKPHFAQLFKEKGCYNHLKKGASVKRNDANAPEAEESKVTVVSEPDTEVETEANSEAVLAQEQS